MAQKKRSKKIIVFSILFLLIATIVVIAIVKGQKEEVITVQTEKVVTRSVTQTVTATGKVEAEFKVVITPEVTGEITQLAVKDGDNVKAGQLLFKIKSDIYASQLERAEAALESAKAGKGQSEANLNRLLLDMNRTEELFKKGMASQADFDLIKAQWLQAKAGLDAANAAIQQNVASVREAREQLAKTTISSPLSGTVTVLNVEKGERVLGSGFSQGTNVMTISDLKNMLAIVDVDENDIVNVKLGDTARIKVDAFGDEEFIGLVSEISNSAKTSGVGTQEQVVNFEVKIKIQDSESNLRPGMSCNAVIETQTVENVLTVPIQSVTAKVDEMKFEGTSDEQGGATTKKHETRKKKPEEMVFVVEGGKVKEATVTTGISDDNYIVVKSGLKAGQEIVSGPYKAISRELKQDMPVKVDNGGGGKGFPGGDKK
ncbi:MAG: efflux RND transporter periplasmic adaptor subunit [Ignavibacteriales bacterium]|nr:MAG: efflux RND transporter periplasmic adaptor subunit [Ignavibacteriaceae bacterium]MBW7872887.1 efflux RND transporter periplasmic adaptor subunit [Ignavibacteria bacterium]MCZ2142484.1 efflux RND transporter periplasmic adaptor subunit [Ignavibacteriales bacterium]MBV6445365.1 Macrolide export protein MacA [Ignavibacteriaceae bacterium]MBZ0196452.1 efflux RND transporter periplasmic adaptor subunit [Ignavibacteriaceae bacterium]